MSTTTLEKSKREQYSISSIIKKMKSGQLNFGHTLQRADGQWSNKMKGNLISDILQNNPIPSLVFAEQVINGLSIIWNLDGKQRCTIVREFIEDRLKVSTSVTRHNIEYQAMVVNEDGEPVLDENGNPMAEMKEFDIANKKFSQLPEELRDRFLDYCFDAVLYINCSSEDIAYHIGRYNEGKKMTSSQKSVINLGEEYAKMVKNISTMPFFQDGAYMFTRESNNGTINRICIESVMATEFLDQWKKSPEATAEFLNDNATVEMFENLEDTVERLDEVLTDESREVFNSKNSFIWFTVFARFKDTGLEDGKFGEFMTEFIQSLHNKEINGITYDEIESNRNTKDKSVVTSKINILVALMSEFLGIQTENAA